MNGILYMDVSAFEDSMLYEKGLLLLSKERKERLAKLKNPASARLSLGAGVLLYLALQRCGYLEHLEKIKSSIYGKPYLEEIQFSLSHSEKYALCAYANGNIGADLQRIKEKIPQRTKKILSQEEQDFLKQYAETERRELFYRLWARKESLIKWDGRGLRLPLEQLSFVKNNTIVDTVAFDGKILYFQEYPKIISNYAVCICSESENFPKQMEEITPKMLKNL